MNYRALSYSKDVKFPPPAFGEYSKCRTYTKTFMILDFKVVLSGVHTWRTEFEFKYEYKKGCITSGPCKSRWFQQKCWPLKADVSNIVKSGFRVLPIRSSSEMFLEWRLSFSDAEQSLCIRLITVNLYVVVL